MKQYQYLQIGTFHTNHCEDYLLSSEIGKDKLLLAIMDGCTSGIDSYLISTLIGKSLRKIAKELNYLEFAQSSIPDLENLLHTVLLQLFEQLRRLRTMLDLEHLELLSTLILGIVDIKNKAAEIITIGDGVVFCDGTVYDFDQKNKPDYIGYHLETNFNDWFEKQEQLLSLKNIKDLSISTDGIFTFGRLSQKGFQILDEEIAFEILMLDTSFSDSENMLKKKVLQLEREHQLKHGDDLGMIRLIFEN